MNRPYRSPDELPGIIPVFPLAEALLLPRARMPLNIFEPRYLAMIDHALAGDRVIGMIQPEPDAKDERPRLCPIGCAGRLTQFAETGDGRYLITLSGVSRFALEGEEPVDTPFRQCRVAFDGFAEDLVEGAGEAEVDRPAVLAAMRAFAKATNVEFDWSSVEGARNEALVNALSILGPFGTREKQALLAARTLRQRAETLVALTEIELARASSTGSSTLQ